MKTLKDLNIDTKKTISNDKLLNLKGGSAEDQVCWCNWSGSCSDFDLTLLKQKNGETCCETCRNANYNFFIYDLNDCLQGVNEGDSWGTVSHCPN